MERFYVILLPWASASNLFLPALGHTEPGCVAAEPRLPASHRNHHAFQGGKVAVLIAAVVRGESKTLIGEHERAPAREPRQ